MVSGIDWSEGDLMGRTLLFTVVVGQAESREESFRRVKFLLDHHCDPCLSTAGGFYCLHLALFNENQPLFELIADYIYESEKSFDNHRAFDNNRTYLQVACEKGRVEAVEYLVRRGADIMVQDNKQSSCLQLAIMFGAPSNALEIATIVVGEEVRLDLIEQIGEAGCRALHLAIFTNNLSLMKYLIKCGADKEAAITQNRK